ncbi:MAG: D-alanyl-D-alanine carboxypeptidase/D-alanyl-D-alanine-endopeptidase [Rhodothermales bacterium]|nr:D-alanyl-D-alanine carboxypeptidase/D-alanyl-D-alanine-endopeptidase [Rhodothermales bacterium]
MARRGPRGRPKRATSTSVSIQVEGSVSARYAGAARIPIQDPTAFTLHAFVEALEAAGIRTDLEVIDADDLEEDVTYGEDAPLLVHLSPPLIEILTAVNEKSNNFFAEQVFRTFAPGGTTAGGERRVFEFLEAAGIPTQGLSIRDGSGLSRKNLVSPETLGRLLAHMYTHDLRDAFLRTLPQGGQEGTTLRYRLAGLPVFAKTGSLEHVRALSGYVAGPDDTPYAFVLFANNYTSKSSLVAVAQNEIAQAIARGGV